ncbi:MAG: stage V sporulation T C-terminal domain-containing protein [Mycoplasmatota bacterium]
MGTGIVRRVDELGRIVIPKEIRKSFRIKDGETVEISINDEGIILKKHSFLNKINDIASYLVCSIYNNVKQTIIITDLNKVIASSKNVKNDYLNKEISNELFNIINNRKDILNNYNEKIKIINEKIQINYYIRPLIVNGDVVGSIILFDDNFIKEDTIKIVTIANDFLEKYLEI